MKQLFSLIFILGLLSSLSGCFNSFRGSDNPSITEAIYMAVVENDIETFSNGNISEITERVFGVESDNTATVDSDNGIIAELFANADMQIASTDEATITYIIVSPDISHFFSEQTDKLQSIANTEELRQTLIDYAETATKKEHTVVLPYTISDEGELEIAYDDPEFINAMTGGLLDAYADLYNQYLEGVE